MSENTLEKNGMCPEFATQSSSSAEKNLALAKFATQSSSSAGKNLAKQSLIFFSLGMLVLMMILLFNFLFLSYKIKEKMEMKAYFEKDALEGKICFELDKMPQVKEFIFISREQAWKDLEGQMEKELFATLSNPLPSTLRIFFKGEYVNREGLKNLQRRLEKLSGIEEVVYPEKAYNRLFFLLNLARFIGGGLLIIIIGYTSLVMLSVSGKKGAEEVPP